MCMYLYLPEFIPKGNVDMSCVFSFFFILCSVFLDGQARCLNKVKSNNIEKHAYTRSFQTNTLTYISFILKDTPTYGGSYDTFEIVTEIVHLYKQTHGHMVHIYIQIQ